jgi:hypothetical protein
LATTSEAGIGVAVDISGVNEAASVNGSDDTSVNSGTNDSSSSMCFISTAAESFLE